MTRASERVLREAELSPEAPRYQTMQVAVALAAVVVGIPLLPVALPLAAWYYRRYYENLRVLLTNRDLKVHRGILTREEKSIPLEKITDLRVYQGPIMRRMGLKGLAVETAGQTTQAGALVSIVGIVDTDGFRDAALSQRDRISDAFGEGETALPATTGGDTQAVEEGGSPAVQQAMLETLGEIRDTLKRVEGRLGEEERSAP